MNQKDEKHWIVNPGVSETQKLEMFEAYVAGTTSEARTEGYSDGYAEGYGKGVRFRKVARTAKELNELDMNAIVHGPDGLAWQSMSALDNELHWSNAHEGWKWSYSSAGLVAKMKKEVGADNIEFKVLWIEDWNS